MSASSVSASFGVGAQTLRQIAAEAEQHRFQSHADGHTRDQVDQIVHAACFGAVRRWRRHGRRAAATYIDVQRFSRYLADRLVRDINSLTDFVATLQTRKLHITALQSMYATARPRMTFARFCEREGGEKPVAISVKFIAARGTKRKAVHDDPDESVSDSDSDSQ